jgi:hypothetical protein
LYWRIYTGKTLDDTDAWNIGANFLGPGIVVPGKVLLRTIRRLRALRGEIPPFPEPAPEATERSPFAYYDRGELFELENRVAELDDVERKPRQTDSDKGCASAERRMLLDELDGMEFWRPADPEACRQWLETHGLKTLLGYFDAGLSLRRYLRYPERKFFIPEAPEDEDITSAWVSIDWFRLGVPTPPGMSPMDWIARCERALRDDEPEPGDTPWPITREIEGKTYKIEWREDVRTPALLRATACPC